MQWLTYSLEIFKLHGRYKFVLEVLRSQFNLGISYVITAFAEYFWPMATTGQTGSTLNSGDVRCMIGQFDFKVWSVVVD